MSLFFIYILAKKNRLIYIPLAIVTFLLILYYPASIYFDITKQGVFLSTLETNKSEVFEFILSLTLHDYLIVLFSFFILVLHSYTATQLHSFIRNKYLTYIFLVLFSYIYSINDQISLNLFKIHNLYKNYSNELNKIKDAKNQPDTWNIISNEPSKETIVVIIGESVSKKYLSVYGYNDNTTPFLNKINGRFFSNYISPAGFTALSIPRTLATSQNNIINYENNAISLAKKAGYKTYWISNQGFIGEHDTAISMLASKSDYISYQTDRDYINNKNDDFKLLDIFNSINKNHEKKVIFIHMLGSHPDFCARLHNYNVVFSSAYGKNFNCYLSTIHKMDYFVSNIYHTLNKNKQEFSLIYFSDHGLKNSSHDIHKIRLIHDDTHQDNFDVPFFILKDNDQRHEVIDKKISGFNFLNYFSEEVGITTKNLSNNRATQRMVLSGEELIPYENLILKQDIYAIKK
ncbi:phosphoethanolamine transferase [Acinetobacter sp. 256-1]|uniref:phosphoethanolamine transferase n=1 Tax=Acinetobacter sp. 256-1 TaxID=2746721 RepID=UPI0025789F69|nr:phosphoethanolamine transferase [Acinetobacter sp. 256-1]MDM1758387.1 phosphoethanolamine transferase [Acinetobacter sp. 256-1]